MKWKTSWLLPMLLSAAALFLGCKAGVPQLRIEAVEANRSPVLLGVASVFMKIENSGGSDDAIVAARADVPGSIAELHDIRDGQMVTVDAIEIPAATTVVLRPARHHIMILNLPKDAKEGFKFTVTLTFKKSGEKKVPLELTPFTPGGSSQLRS